MMNVPLRKPRLRSKKLAILVVTALIFMLAATGWVQYRRSVAAAREGVLRTDLLRMRDAIHQYSAHQGRYPSSLDSLVAEGYLRRIPVDPFTKSKETWTTTRAGRHPSKPGAEPEVYDVKSGAHGAARDGSRYSDW
jgi:general secretion pathway protein G